MDSTVKLERRTLGKTGISVSAVGLGGIPLQRLSDAEAVELITACVEAGINFIDSARAYTDSEAKIGAALQKSGLRKRAVLATKTMSRDKPSMAADIDKSLKEFRADYIDLYQLHNLASKDALELVLAEDGAYRALEDAKRGGKILRIGITGHNLEALCEAIKTGLFETVQYPHNPIERGCEKELIPLAKSMGIGLIAMKPAGGGALSDIPLSLRYILTSGTDIAIPGIDKMEQIQANLSAIAPLVPPDENESRWLQDEAKSLGETFCRRCGYCMPCSQGLNIPLLLLLPTYSKRYDLHGWSVDRLKDQKKTYSDCIECGECEERCPYSLPIRDLLAEARDLFAKK